MAHVHHPSPQERRKRLNLWLIFVVVLVLAALAALALVLLLQDEDEHGGGGPTTTSTTVVADPEQYAQALYAAWMANDRAGATQYASPEAIEQLFSVPYVPAQTPNGPVDPLTYAGCEGAAGSVVCTWTGQLEQLVMTVRNSTGGLSVLVVQVEHRGG
ncbi:MAG TPA: hypothetical protein VIH82_02800 [Acidimicrobiia bacterium]